MEKEGGCVVVKCLGETNVSKGSKDRAGRAEGSVTGFLKNDNTPATWICSVSSVNLAGRALCSRPSCDGIISVVIRRTLNNAAVIGSIPIQSMFLFLF